MNTTSEIPPEKQEKRNEEDTGDFHTDFLISPGDIYPNRKVKLEDVTISEATTDKFEELCEKHPEAFLKNNRDIGRTSLIEMEIDTGDCLPMAQNP